MKSLLGILTLQFVFLSSMQKSEIDIITFKQSLEKLRKKISQLKTSDLAKNKSKLNTEFLSLDTPRSLAEDYLKQAIELHTVFHSTPALMDDSEKSKNAIVFYLLAQGSLKANNKEKYEYYLDNSVSQGYKLAQGEKRDFLVEKAVKTLKKVASQDSEADLLVRELANFSFVDLIHSEAKEKDLPPESLYN